MRLEECWFNFVKNNSMLDSIESAIEDIKAGKLVIVVDDDDREDEGDFITAAPQYNS